MHRFLDYAGFSCCRTKFQQVVMISVIVCTALCTGCTTDGSSSRESLRLRDRPALSVSYPVDVAEGYTIGVGDQLHIRFYFHEELNEDLPVRPDGRVSLQLVDDVQVVGLTPAEAAKVLKVSYAKLLRKPDITVQVVQSAPRRIYVGGEVHKPGLIETGDVITAVKAIMQAGGVKDTANLESVVVLRYRAGMAPEFLRVNLRDDIKTGTKQEDIPLRAYDVVFVPKTFIATANQFVSQYIDKMIPLDRNVGAFWFTLF
jgi:polysaccharide biosynthesis/export protein